MSVKNVVPAKKTGSKLAQGVRQVMEQGKKTEATVKDTTTRKVSVSVSPGTSANKSSPATAANKAPVGNRDDKNAILHPERIWPD